MYLMEVLENLLESGKDVYKIKDKEVDEDDSVFFVTTDIVEGARNVIMVCDSPHFKTDTDLCVNSTTIAYEYEKINNSDAKYLRGRFDLR